MSIVNDIINEANGYLAKGNIDSAIVLYNSTLYMDISKKDKSAFNYALGLLYYTKGLLNDSDKCFTQSIKYHYNTSDSFNYKGLIAKINHDVPTAEKYYSEALKNNSKNAFAMNNLANLLINKGDNATAKKLLINAARIQKNNPIPRYNLMKFAIATNDSQLEEFKQDYIEKSLNQIYFIENEGKVKYSEYKNNKDLEQDTMVSKYIQSIQTSDLKQSELLLDSIIDQSYDFKKSNSKTKKALGSLYARKANALLGLKEYGSALKEFDSAVSLLGLKSSILVNKGICLSNLNQTKEAISYFNKLENVNDASGLIAKCTLAKIALDENMRKDYNLKEPQLYFASVLKKLSEKNFNQIDNSKFKVSEAVIEGTNSEKCFVFRRALSGVETKKVFEKEQDALKNFYYSSNQLNLDLKVVRPLGIVENTRGYNTIVLTRAAGNTVLDELINLRKQDELSININKTTNKIANKITNAKLDSIFDNLAEEFVKVRLIGNHSCEKLTDKLHSKDIDSNTLLYQGFIMNKFIGNKDYSGSIYNLMSSNKANLISSVIEQDYNLIARILAHQNADFYKDMSLKNILISNDNFVHIDFETMRNFPFVLDVATALNMGDFITNKDALAKKIYDANNELSLKLNLPNGNLGSLEEFIIALHAAGVQRGLTHHASFTDWHTRLGRDEYKMLARETLNNVISDLIWLKDNALVTSSEKDKIYSMGNLLTEVYN